PASKVNVNGGSIAIGHPLGATGARLVTTVAMELRRSRTRYGLATQCIGAGKGISTILGRMDWTGALPRGRECSPRRPAPRPMSLSASVGAPPGLDLAGGGSVGGARERLGVLGECAGVAFEAVAERARRDERGEGAAQALARAVARRPPRDLLEALQPAPAHEPERRDRPAELVLERRVASRTRGARRLEPGDPLARAHRASAAPAHV